MVVKWKMYIDNVKGCYSNVYYVYAWMGLFYMPLYLGVLYHCKLIYFHYFGPWLHIEAIFHFRRYLSPQRPPACPLVHTQQTTHWVISTKRTPICLYPANQAALWTSTSTHSLQGLASGMRMRRGIATPLPGWRETCLIAGFIVSPWVLALYISIMMCCCPPFGGRILESISCICPSIYQSVAIPQKWCVGIFSYMSALGMVWWWCTSFQHFDSVHYNRPIRHF